MALMHADCLACHHELRSPGWRQRRGFVSSPGRPMPRSFPLALIELNVDQYGDAMDGAEFDHRLRRLFDAFASRPFGRPDEIRDAARALAGWSDTFYDRRLKKANFNVASGPILMRRLCELNLDQIPDYDTARQIASALQVVYRDWVEHQESPVSDHERIEAILSSWDTNLNLGRYPKSEQRDSLSLSILRELAMDQELEGFGGWLPVTLGFPRNSEPYWDASQKNPILLAFGPLLDPSQMRDAYMSETFKEPLQRINNDGLKIALDVASHYDPFLFREQLRLLDGLMRSISTE
jgi:hypothetical protein